MSDEPRQGAASSNEGAVPILDPELRELLAGIEQAVEADIRANHKSLDQSIVDSQQIVANVAALKNASLTNVEAMKGLLENPT